MKLFIITIFSGISLFGYSQNLEFGIKAGATLGFFDNEEKLYDFYEPKVGFTIRSLGRFKVSDDFFLKSELGFSQINTSYENSDSKILLNRIELVLLASYRILKAIDVEIGPEVSNIIQVTAKDSQNKDDITQQYQRFNLALNIGTNFRVNQEIEMFAAYSFGLLYYDQIQFISEDQEDLGTKGLNRVSYLSLGINYYFKN